MVPTICRFFVMSSTTRIRVFSVAKREVGAGFIAWASSGGKLLADLGKPLQGVRQSIEIEIFRLLPEREGKRTQVRPAALFRDSNEARGKFFEFSDGHRLAKPRPAGGLFFAQTGQQLGPLRQRFRWHRRRRGDQSVCLARGSRRWFERLGGFQEPLKFRDQIRAIERFADKSFANFPRAGLFFAER